MADRLHILVVARPGLGCPGLESEIDLTQAASIADAQAMLRSKPFDGLIVADGAALEALADATGAPILLVSSDTPADPRAADCLPPEVSPEQLCRSLRNAARLHRAEQAAARAALDLREQSRIAGTLHRIGMKLAEERDLQRLVQLVTDESTALIGAEFGAFFYNVLDTRGESYMLYTLSGVSRDHFAQFPMPRNTELFSPTFRAEGPVRLDDVTADPRYGRSGPHHGMPAGHLPVRSYLAVPVVSRSGEPIGGLFFGHQDVGVFTERDEQLMQSVASQAAVAIDNARLYEALRRGEEHYRFMAESIPQIVWTATPNGELDYFNRRWLDYTGQTMEESLGQGWKPVIHPEDLKTCEQRWSASIASGQVYDIEYRFRRGRDGAYRWHLGRAEPMRDGAGEIVRWFGTCTDIDDHKRAEQALKESRDALEAANNAKDQFLAVLSHELRTPLMPVLLVVQSLQSEPGLAAAAVEGLEVIRRNVELEARLIDDLLDLTRISKGKLQLNFETVDLHAMIRSAMDICAVEVVGKKIGTTLDLAATRHHVRGDPARLQQIFWNLIKNAIKFTPPGGHVTVHSYDDAAGAMKIQVLDTGIGIEPAALSRIFDAFEQADRSVTRQFGGLGLGLAISKALIDLHGGTLTATSAGAGRGATFTLTLRPSASLPTTHERDRSPAAAVQQKPDIRILLVDDHLDTNRAMARLLQRMGYQVQTADSVRSALDAAGQGKFDLLISDIGLPDGSGLELMRQLLERQPIKGIALSGFGMDEDVKKSKEAGFYEHLTKPINFKRLETAIQHLITAPGP